MNKIRLNSIYGVIALWIGTTLGLWVFLNIWNLGPFAIVWAVLLLTFWRFMLHDASSSGKKLFFIGARENEIVWAVNGEEIPVKPIGTSEGKNIKKNGDVVEAKGKSPGIMKTRGIGGTGIYLLPNLGKIGGVKIMKSTMAWLEYEQEGKEYILKPRKEETQYIFTKIGNYAVPILNVEDKEKIQVDFIFGIPGKFVNVKKPVFSQDEPFARVQNIIQGAVIDYAFANLNFDFMVNTDEEKQVKGDRKVVFQDILNAVSAVKQQLIDEVGFEMGNPLILDFDLSGELGKQLYEKITEVEKVRLDAKITLTKAKADADAKVEEARGITTLAKANAGAIKETGDATNKVLKERRDELGEFAFGMNQFNEGISNFQGEAISININTGGGGGGGGNGNLLFTKSIGGGGGKGNGNTPPKKTNKKNS